MTTEMNALNVALELLELDTTKLKDILNEDAGADAPPIAQSTINRWRSETSPTPVSVKAFLRLQICATWGIDSFPGDTLSSVVERVKSRKDGLADLAPIDDVIRAAFKARHQMAGLNKSLMN